jgi:hypothetical protein
MAAIELKLIFINFITPKIDNYLYSINRFKHFQGSKIKDMLEINLTVKLLLY